MTRTPVSSSARANLPATLGSSPRGPRSKPTRVMASTRSSGAPPPCSSGHSSAYGRASARGDTARADGGDAETPRPARDRTASRHPDDVSRPDDTSRRHRSPKPWRRRSPASCRAPEAARELILRPERTRSSGIGRQVSAPPRQRRGDGDGGPAPHVQRAGGHRLRGAAPAWRGGGLVGCGLARVHQVQQCRRDAGHPFRRQSAGSPPVTARGRFHECGRRRRLFLAGRIQRGLPQRRGGLRPWRPAPTEPVHGGPAAGGGGRHRRATGGAVGGSPDAWAEGRLPRNLRHCRRSPSPPRRTDPAANWIGRRCRDSARRGPGRWPPR